MTPFSGLPLPFGRLTATDNKRPIYPRSLVEVAYEQLLSMIVTMKILPGDHIGIEALARKLEISQTPIREALTLLEAQKLVQKIPNVGFRAASLLSPTELTALYEVRLMIEPKMAALAAERGDDQAFDALKKMSVEMKQRSKGGDVAYAQFAEGDAQLHYLIALASGNRFIAETVMGLHVHLHIFRFLVNTNAVSDAANEHSLLIDAILKRDPAAAEAAMQEHLIASQHRVDCVTATEQMQQETETEQSIAKRSRKRGRRESKGRSSASL